MRTYLWLSSTSRYWRNVSCRKMYKHKSSALFDPQPFLGPETYKQGISSFAKIDIEDTHFWFWVAKNNILLMNTNANRKNTEEDIINMLEFLVDINIVEIDWIFFHQIVVIPIRTHCVSRLAEIFCTHLERNSYRICIIWNYKVITEWRHIFEVKYSTRVFSKICLF